MYLRRAELRGHGVSIIWRCSEPLHYLAYGIEPALLSARLVPGETLAQTGKDLTALPDKGLWLHHAALQLLHVQNPLHSKCLFPQAMVTCSVVAQNLIAWNDTCAAT